MAGFVSPSVEASEMFVVQQQGFSIGCLADLCQDPKKIEDPGSAGSKIWDPGGSWIQHFRFCERSYGSWTLLF